MTVFSWRLVSLLWFVWRFLVTTTDIKYAYMIVKTIADNKTSHVPSLCSCILVTLADHVKTKAM